MEEILGHTLLGGVLVVAALITGIMLLGMENRRRARRGLPPVNQFDLRIVLGTLLFFLIISALDAILPGRGNYPNALSRLVVGFMLATVETAFDMRGKPVTHWVHERTFAAICGVTAWLVIGGLDLWGPSRDDGTLINGAVIAVAVMLPRVWRLRSRK